MNRKIMEVVISEDNGLRSFIGYIGYNRSYISYNKVISNFNLFGPKLSYNHDEVLSLISH